MTEVLFKRRGIMPVGSVVARNKLDGITVLSSDARGGPAVEWGARGDANGDDIQFVPDAVLETPAFRRALARGVVEIIEDESDPEVVQAIGRQVDAFRRRQEGAKAEMSDVIDRPTNRDSISLFCVGPDSRGNGTCGTPVVVMAKAKADDKPPLCNQHVHLALQYVPEHKIEADGTKVIWNRVTVTSRERD